MELKNKIAVVAGASGGIGREISRELAGEGTLVFLVARREGVLEALKNDIENAGGKARIYLADLTNEDSISGLARFIEKNFGRVDILINAQGIGVYKKFPLVSFGEWKKQIAVNVDSVFLLIQKLLPLLEKSERAYVISMGSGMGKIGVSGRSPYCASKFALRGLMLSLAKEYKRSHIKFVLLTLGSVLTAFGPLSLEEKLEKQKKGKKYLDPIWLAGNIVAKIKHDSLNFETPIYPKHYFEESRKGKT